ncbi:hypothetical protein O181_052043 [Austropuccinia psidii MF-1]|uniref:Uncharacterized protein n=1 Tax=Austropuccinia psidii MF-1 TaxID=1389203 RepID=A0A9Q3E1X4_9BASI|nr:hypothetical protein [Austropuccinia psidii MF-1]
MPQPPGNSTEFNELKTSAPESGSEISDMVSSDELGIEVERLTLENNQDPPVLPECEHTFMLNICYLSKPDSFFRAFISAQPPSSQKQNLKRYENGKTVIPCALTENVGKDDIIFSGKVEIIYKEQFVPKITHTFPRLEEIQNNSKTPDYVCQKVC